MGFGSDMLKSVNSMQEWVNDGVIDTFIEMDLKAVELSPTQPDAPHAKGLFINSWYPAINEFDPTIGSVTSLTGENSKARILAIKGSKAFLKQDGFMSLSNNLNYAANVEYLGWAKTAAYAPARNAITYIIGKNRQ